MQLGDGVVSIDEMHGVSQQLLNLHALLLRIRIYIRVLGPLLFLFHSSFAYPITSREKKYKLREIAYLGLSVQHLHTRRCRYYIDIPLMPDSLCELVLLQTATEAYARKEQQLAGFWLLDVIISGQLEKTAVETQQATSINNKSFNKTLKLIKNMHAIRVHYVIVLLDPKSCTAELTQVGMS
ncbi:hypothetical protein ACJX0J_010956 [Zea mays]